MADTDSRIKVVDLSAVTVHASKHKGQVARKLLEMGIAVIPIPDDEGDADRFILSKRVAIDRRTGSSFLNGIMDKTLFTGAIFLREHYRLPVLMVEGQFNYEHRMFDPQAVRGALSSMMLEYGLTVLSTANVDETVHLIAMMARQEQLGIPEISLVPKRKAPTVPDMQRRIVEMLPGCGRVLARDLLQHFGSLERLALATEDELRQVRGIGVRKAKEMVAVMSAEYESVDTEKQVEDAIEVDHRLLFGQRVKLLARQHHIYDDEKDRHIVDMVFVDSKTKEVILVELKRGKLEPWHREQLRRYLDHAAESTMIRGYLDRGFAVRGILASPEAGKLAARDERITVATVDSDRIIAILKRLRRRRRAGRG